MKKFCQLITCLIFIFLCTPSLQSQSSNYPVNNKIPALQIEHEERTDTITIVDVDTYDTETQIVKRTEPFVWSIDTTSVFNYDTYQETTTIVRSKMSLEELYGNDSLFEPWSRAKSIEKHVNYLRHEAGLPIDTIHVFDYENYEETVSVVRRRDDCYCFEWGQSVFSDSHELSKERFKLLLNSPLKMAACSKCDPVESYQCTVVMVSGKNTVRVFELDEQQPLLKFDKVYENMLEKDLKIYIEDMRVNGKRRMDAILINVR